MHACVRVCACVWVVVWCESTCAATASFSVWSRMEFESTSNETLVEIVLYSVTQVFRMFMFAVSSSSAGCGGDETMAEGRSQSSS